MKLFLLNSISLITLCSIFYSCNTEVASGKMFDKKLPKSTGIKFKNILTETDSLNYFTYPYLYMGGGVAVGDINNDGLQDLYFTGNMVDNKLYLNKGNLEFEDITEQAKVTGDKRWFTGVTMVDVNNDGFVDIYASVSGIQENKKNVLYINNKDNTFSEQAEKYGLANAGNSVQSTFFDYDNDGDLDAIVTRQFDQTSIYRNDKAHDNSIATTHSWFGLKLKGNGIECNRDALGTKIEIEYIEDNKKRTQVRELRASNGFSAQGDSRVLFGLGEYKDDVTININWCGQLPNNRTVISTLNQYIEIKQ